MTVSAEENNDRAFSAGDINSDGHINTLDYVLLKKHLSGQSEITDPTQLKSCDVNGDGSTDDRDLLRLKNIVYYGEVDNLDVEVASKEIHTPQQRRFLEEGHDSISRNKGGGAASIPITLQYGDSIIASGSSYTIRVSESPDMSNSKRYTSSTREVKIDNSKVQQLYFWTVNNGSYTSKVQAFYVDDIPLRNLSTGTIGNARDFGGFETEDGFVVKQGMLYRGYMMEPGSNLQKNRNILINDLGIQTEIDIKEKQSDSSIYYDTSELNKYPKLDFEHYLRRYLKFELYGGYLNSSADYQSLGTIFRIFEDLADESRYPIYIHCRIGADRTGLMCFLINALCGVSLEDLYLDYTFTTYSGDPRNAGWIENDYVKQIQMAEGRTFAEKTYNYLVKLARKYAQKNPGKTGGLSPDEYASKLARNIDSMISILKTSKPSTKTYLAYPKAVNTVLLCNGEEQIFEVDDDYLFNIRGNKATKAGEYTAVISLKDPQTYSWADGSKSDYSISWSIIDERVAVAAPVVEESAFVYNGEEQELVFDEKDYYTVDGNKQTCAGEYEAVVSLADKTKYMWEDGSNDDLKFAWKIEQAEVNLEGISFTDTVYQYDGEEKKLEFEGELPEGIASVTYSENSSTGHPNKETVLEVTMSFVMENENYKQPEDMKATMKIEPLFTEIELAYPLNESDEADETMTQIIHYGEEYELPICNKEGFRFAGWCVEIDGQFILVEQSGIWEYESKESLLTLIPLFELEEEVETSVVGSEDEVTILINLSGEEGVAQVIESDYPLNDENLNEGRTIGLYKMNTSSSYSLGIDSLNKYHYVMMNDHIILYLSQEQE